jgi:hypothetical protein
VIGQLLAGAACSVVALICIVLHERTETEDFPDSQDGGQTDERPWS